MDAKRSGRGVLGALLGFIGGYIVAWRQGRKTRRALALHQLARESDDEAAQDYMAGKLARLRKRKDAQQ